MGLPAGVTCAVGERHLRVAGKGPRDVQVLKQGVSLIPRTQCHLRVAGNWEGPAPCPDTETGSKSGTKDSVSPPSSREGPARCPGTETGSKSDTKDSVSPPSSRELGRACAMPRY